MHSRKGREGEKISAQQNQLGLEHATAEHLHEPNGVPHP